jgi:hypothetical protein
VLFPSEANRFLNKLKKREQQLGAALARAETNGLPGPLVELYRSTVTAHQAVQHELLRLADVAKVSFCSGGPGGVDPGVLANIEDRAAALERRIEAFISASPDSRPQQRRDRVAGRALGVAALTSGPYSCGSSAHPPRSPWRPALNHREDSCNAVRYLPSFGDDMPELLYPGVYLVETCNHAHAIEGVSTSTEGLVAGIVDGARMSHHPVGTPEWTDGNAHDPGVTMLELFGWTTESLAFGVALALGLDTAAVDSHRRQATALDPPP